MLSAQIETPDFEDIFNVPAGHCLLAVRSRSRGGPVTTEFWEHEEYDSGGRLTARYESYEELTPAGPRHGCWRKLDGSGRVMRVGGRLHRACESYTANTLLGSIAFPTRNIMYKQDQQTGHNLFRNQARPDLYCAVAEDKAVPLFIREPGWEFAGHIMDKSAAPPGFREAPARSASSLLGFYVFHCVRSASAVR